MMNFKLRIYKLSGPKKGNLDHEEYFKTAKAMDNRYNELFIPERWSLNPTAWRKNGQTWNRILGY